MKPGIVAILALVASCVCAQTSPPVASGPFAPTDETLKQFPCPEWFRDAKLGIWAHGGPVAAPGGFGGNWYARQMCVHHVQPYGHPSKFGYKDVIRATDYTADEIRFTRSKDGPTFYAIALGLQAAPVYLKAVAFTIALAK